ncbi:uncharacterized protein PF3D7_1120000-like [Macrobrachium rosenbergii]|uniref:uncharacterized protein PF3D7_1120000-like n=1 Tax=Macrobrachium rosenbergii TaxID=79674 RepID=UPI0034D4F8C3
MVAFGALLVASGCVVYERYKHCKQNLQELERDVEKLQWEKEDAIEECRGLKEELRGREKRVIQDAQEEERKLAHPSEEEKQRIRDLPFNELKSKTGNQLKEQLRGVLSQGMKLEAVLREAQEELRKLISLEKELKLKKDDHLLEREEAEILSEETLGDGVKSESVSGVKSEGVSGVKCESVSGASGCEMETEEGEQDLELLIEKLVEAVFHQELLEGVLRVAIAELMLFLLEQDKEEEENSEKMNYYV